jgi:hypothetical protein
MVGQAHHDPVAQHFRYRALHFPAGALVDDVEDLPHRFAPGLGLRPAGEGFRHRIEHDHQAAGVGDDHPVADAAQGHPQIFLVVGQGGVVGLEFLDQGFQGGGHAIESGYRLAQFGATPQGQADRKIPLAQGAATLGQGAQGPESAL